jgi:methylenetetrahydrofolate reductase (NADPH)
MSSVSRLEALLRAGEFAVTGELNPRDSADPQGVSKHAEVLACACDAINTADSSGANAHMSSLGQSALLAHAGFEPVMQLACRDRNRIALQGELLAGAALGVGNVMCLTGDGVQAGDQPEAKPVFDLDSMGLLRTARIMRDQGRFLSGRELEVAPKWFLGAASNPFVPPYDFRPLRLKKKIEAGAEFIQTQYCFDVPRLRSFMAQVRDMGLDEQVFILVGVGPLRSLKAAQWIQAHVPGIVVPESIERRLGSVPTDKQREEGERICVEIIQQVREIPGVKGVHVMAYRQEERVCDIIERAGLLPRPTVQEVSNQG